LGRCTKEDPSEEGIDSSTPVTILVDISPDHYDRILSEFSEESPMYVILKNGSVLHLLMEAMNLGCTNDSRSCRDVLSGTVTEIEEAIRLSVSRFGRTIDRRQDDRSKVLVIFRSLSELASRFRCA
jgi:hypothetical protein